MPVFLHSIAMIIGNNCIIRSFRAGPMFIDDEILAEKHRQSNPYPALLIAATTLAAFVVTLASTLTLSA